MGLASPLVTHLTLKFNKILATSFDPKQASLTPKEVSDVTKLIIGGSIKQNTNFETCKTVRINFTG